MPKSAAPRARRAGVDKAPAIFKQDAEEFLRCFETRTKPEFRPAEAAASPAPESPQAA